MNAGLAFAGLIAAIVLLTTDFLPYRIVSTERIKTLEAQVQSLQATAQRSGPQNTPWMWQRPTQALDRGAYAEKKNVASAPMIIAH